MKSGWYIMEKLDMFSEIYRSCRLVGLSVRDGDSNCGRSALENETGVKRRMPSAVDSRLAVNWAGPGAGGRGRAGWAEVQRFFRKKAVPLFLPLSVSLSTGWGGPTGIEARNVHCYSTYVQRI